MSVMAHMLAELPFTSGELRLLLATAPQRYKLHYIEKRNNRGQRLIAQPTAEMKLLQRWVVSKYLSQLPVHSAATAYVAGKSIEDHAAPHASSKYLLKLDFTDFFSSITSTDFIRHIRRFSELGHEDAAILSRVLFYRHPSHMGLRLSIGAPSSPTVSNTVMYGFDERLTQYCNKSRIRYTRYADDLALSTNVPHSLDQALAFVKSMCSQLPYPSLSLNDSKTVFTSRKFSRQLTGLVLANDGTISLGRTRKRLIRAMVHRASLGQLNVEELNHLRGLLSFAYSVEPEFIERLRSVVGELTISFLFPVGKLRE